MKLVVFDLDGTLTRPFFDFKAIRREVQAALHDEYEFPIDEPLLENIEKLPDGPRALATKILHDREAESIEHSQLNDGAREILDWIKAEGFKTALLSRNRGDVVSAVVRLHRLEFDRVASRDDGPLKPDPRSVLQFTEHFAVPPNETLVVGDFRYDIEAGKGAGARTCLLTNGSTPGFEVTADHVIERLEELRGILTEARGR